MTVYSDPIPNPFLNRIPLSAQCPPEKVRSTTGFHANQLHLQIRRESQ
jgi:hypothetical protein